MRVFARVLTVIMMIALTLVAHGIASAETASAPPLPAKPDLVVTDLIPIGFNKLLIVVRNQGTANAGPFTVVATNSSAPHVRTFQVAGLAKGQARSILMSEPAPWCESTKVTADALHQVAESNEVNNSKLVKWYMCP